MVELQEKNQTIFGDHFAQRESELSAFGDETLALLRTESLRRWEAAGWPTSKDEEWKYTPLRSLAETQLRPSYAADIVAADLERLPIGLTGATRLVFVNGRFQSHLSELAGLPAGVTIASLSSVLTDQPPQRLGRIATLDGKLGSTNDERFKDLNTAFLVEGAHVSLEPGVVVEDPIHLVFLTKAEGPSFVTHPRVLVEIGKNAQAKVVESYVGLSGAVFTNAVTEVFVDADAMLEHVRVQDETDDSYHIGLSAVHQERDSTYTSYNVSFGARTGRTDVNLWLNGEHTESRLDGVYVGHGEQVLDNKTRIDHAHPNCHSFEVYKGILMGRSTGVFNGKIFVYEDAQKTDAKQTNQALLLSPTATINTKPQLEIFADDVKCTHGATVGQLREDAMFYLRSRGIPFGDAQALLTYAFASEVLERITMEPVRVGLEKLLYEKLAEARSLPEGLEG